MAERIDFFKRGRFDEFRFAELLVRAKGENRTMKEFAIECGVSPSTFSRILNKVNRKASSPELLQTIAANADPFSWVTLEDLAEANGYALECYSQPIEGSGTREISVTRDVLIRNLLESGNTIALRNPHYTISESIAVSPDIFIVSDIFGTPNGGWFIKVLLPEREKNIYGPIPYKERLAKMCFEWFAIFSAIALNCAEEQDLPACYSIVVTDEKQYEIIYNEFQNTAVCANISVFFIDTKSELLVKSFMLPYRGDYNPKGR